MAKDKGKKKGKKDKQKQNKEPELAVNPSVTGEAPSTASEATT